MKIPSEYDSIRPYEPEELPDVGAKMRQCKSSLEFQKAFCYGFLVDLLDKASKGCDIDCHAIDNRRRYTFVSNHRDIVLDSALLDKLLIDAGFDTTCEIAIGDNLLSLPWVRDLVRVNKSFIVERSLPPRQMLLASRRLADYMHFAIGEKNENLWIAQREGRAKDSDDRTQPAILKMMAMGGEGSVRDRLVDLHIVPLAISYEYDPCDFLKAKEFQQKRDDAAFRKSAQDDVVSMRTGIMGYKGRIHYHCAPCVDDYLMSLDPAIGKGEFFDLLAAHIDTEIHRHYRLYPVNYVALDMLEQTDAHNDQYTETDKVSFAGYIEHQLAKITMYAMPARNFIAAQ